MNDRTEAALKGIAILMKRHNSYLATLKKSLLQFVNATDSKKELVSTMLARGKAAAEISVIVRRIEDSS